MCWDTAVVEMGDSRNRRAAAVHVPENCSLVETRQDPSFQQGQR